MFLVDSVLKNKSRTYELKDLNGEKKKESFMKKNCYREFIYGLLSRTRQSYKG